MAAALFYEPHLRKFVAFFTICFCVYLILTNSRSSSTVYEYPFSEIQIDDQKILREGFQSLLIHSCLGYTLFGDKPMSFELHPQLDEFWGVWSKYKPLFPSSKYLFTHFEWNGFPGVLLVNKSKFIECFEINKDLFISNYGPNIEVESLFFSLEQGEGETFRSLFSNHALLGVLLGYGRNNALAYHKKEEAKKIDTGDQVELVSFQKPNLLLEIYLKRTKCLLPQFAVEENTEETNMLKSKYLRQQKKINLLYRKRDCLEVTLTQFCQ
jgi:hypothetical protein